MADVPSFVTHELSDPQNATATGAGSTGITDNVGIGLEQGVENTSVGLLARLSNPIQGLTPLSKEDFDATPYFADSGLAYRPGMTREEALDLAQVHTDNQHYEQVYDRATTAGKLGWWAGNLTGGLADPINLLPVGAGFEVGGSVLRAMTAGAVTQAGLGAAVYGPLEAGVARKEQYPFGVDDYVRTVYTGALMGALFGAIGHVGAAQELPNLTKALAEPARIEPPAAAPAEFAEHMEGFGESGAEEIHTPTPQPELEAPRTDGTGNAKVVFPDAAHELLYNFNKDTATPEQLSTLEKHFGVQGADEVQARADAYREDTQWRVDHDKPDFDGRIPAPVSDSARVSETGSNPALNVMSENAAVARHLEERFATIDEPNTANAREQRDAILQEVLSDRAEHSVDDGVVPERDPGGVLDQRTSKGNAGQVQEYSVGEWWRRQLRSVSEVSKGFRDNAPETLFNKLQRLTPEQFRWLAHEHMSQSALEVLYSKFVKPIDEANTVSRPRMAEELYRAVRDEAEGTLPTTGREYIDRRIEAERAQIAKEALDREMANRGNEPVGDALDKFDRVAEVNSPEDAAKLINEQGYLEKVREEQPAAVKNIQDDLEKIKSKKQAWIEAALCLLGIR